MGGKFFETLAHKGLQRALFQGCPFTFETGSRHLQRGADIKKTLLKNGGIMSAIKQTKKPAKKPGERKTVEKVTLIAQLVKSVAELVRILWEIWQ